ncbi:Sensor histidine kinase YesM [Paenibacillus uliginis N3/975]|uniref:histidine kinase n=1 Tax=Paenibacillus uliginis N3/975 TaxID=1313296 RepID=A0A1X7GWJ5_9BACL|nr:sensor histidine kinase [Paenibacillus uliginis]SMF75308.1 Sensor histidine kinase YesM [Paenibacillus uliginis N3/975]
MWAKNKISQMSFGYKLMLSYCILIMIPVILIGNVANRIYTESIREQTRSIIQGTLHQMKNNIAFKMEDTKRISDMLYFDYYLARVLRHYEEGWSSYDSTKNILVPKFQTAVETANRRMWLSVYLKNDTIPEVYNLYENVNPLDTKARLYDIYQYKRLVDKEWYINFPSDEVYGTTLQWRQIEEDSKYGNISLLRRIIDVGGDKYPYEEIGFMRISVSLKDLFDGVDFQKIGEGTTIYISDPSSHVIVSSGSDGVSEVAALNQLSRNEDDLIIRDSLPGLDMELVAIIPADIVEKDSVKVRNLTLFIGLGCVVIFFFLSVIVSRYFGKRVSKIVKVVDSFQEGEFHKRIYFKGNDEFTKIASALNEMGNNIGRLIREVYLADLQKKEAELESLHAQINPHFLYNTLSSISRLAKFGKLEKLQRMVLDLAKFYRLSLNDGRNVIPVKNELEQAQAYIDIQKIKYESRMQVQYDIAPELVRYETVKLILQPFIENVLEHAWMGDNIYIRISGRVTDEGLEFKIIDNGVGFPPGMIKELTGAQDLTNAGYGCKNVDQRIKLHYGQQYGVTLFSRPGIGTTVRIIIPLVKRQVAEGRSKNT